MKLKLPLTGTVMQEGELYGKGDLRGDENDPIRPIDIDLGDVSWTIVGVDLDKEEMEIEVKPKEKVIEPTGAIDADGNALLKERATTTQEKADLLQNARQIIESRTKDELYALSKSAKLKRPFKK